MRTYTVVSGDTLYGIADKLGVARNVLVAANPQLTNIDHIVPGQVIYVPVSGAIEPTPAGLNKYALAGAAALGLGLLWWFFQDKPRKNPKGKRLKRMSALQYARATIKPQHILTAYQVGTALARRYR